MLQLTDVFSGLYKFFRSVKLAVVLIVYLIGLTGVVGFPGSGLSGLNPALSLVLIVIPVALFTVNLSVCAASRIVSRVKAGSYLRRFGWLTTGPDLVHIAILLFLIGGIMSSYGRIDGEVRLAPGEIAVLNHSYMIRLVDFNIELYPDGRPKQYVSVIQLLKRDPGPGQSGAAVIDRAKITVNNPYDFGGLKIYQRSYTGGVPGGSEKAALASVLQAVYDPGYPAILAGIIIFLLGMAFIVADKMR